MTTDTLSQVAPAASAAPAVPLNLATPDPATRLPFVSERRIGRNVKRQHWPADRPDDVCEAIDEGERWGLALAQHYAAAYLAGDTPRFLLERILRDAIGDGWTNDPRLSGLLRVLEPMLAVGAHRSNLAHLARSLRIEHADRRDAANLRAKGRAKGRPRGAGGAK